LILFFIALIGLLGLAQWWLLSALTEKMEEGRRQDAVEIGQAIFEQLGLAEEFAGAEIVFREGGVLIEGPGFGSVEQFGPILQGGLSREWGVGTEVKVLSHDHPLADQLVTGVATERFGVDLPFSENPLDRRLKEFRSGLILGTALILLLALLVMTIAAHKLGVPLRQLAVTARKVGGGDFGQTLPVRGGAEVGEVIQSFNAMSTRLEELQQEAARFREQAHLTEVGEMARGLAHAMRNPLHVIGLSAQRLVDGQLDESRRGELAKSVHAQVQRVDRAMRNFLALSSAGSGHLEQVSLVDTCRDVALELMQSGDPIPNIQIRADSDLPKLLGVPAEVRALVHVLITNAVEAGAAENGGAVEVEVQIQATHSADQVQVEVLDRGCGIASDLQDKLFTPHFTTKEHGAGLGLYLARRIAVNRYGGGLELANRDGGGCRAWLCLKSLLESSND